MTTAATACDLVEDQRVSWMWPGAFLVVCVGWLIVPDPWGSLVSAVGFAVAGALCVGNAMRCRRLHCAFTGPLYLIAAGLFLGRAGGLGVPTGWIVAGAIGGTVAAYVPEWLGTRYFGAAEGASALAATGTLIAAGFVAACCLGPTLFVLFGVSVAGLGAFGSLEPYQPLFLLAGLGSWALAYQQQRRATATCADDACGTCRSRRLSGALLWGSLVALLLAAGYPYAVAHLVG
ncbi:MAG: hypothetical protein E6J71_05940 [Deltaproteobacteria bacterium]|nr:MAG: hypothetical protein E6J71_05940 [Deltaproteobacteria bacterium]